MKTFEITQYKISNSSGLKINQIPKDNTSQEYRHVVPALQAFAIKNSNSKMQSVTDYENSSHMDFQSINRKIN